MSLLVKTKKWGHSIGVLLPSKLVKNRNILPGEEILIDVKKKSNVLKELFGALKFEKPTKELLKEI